MATTKPTVRDQNYGTLLDMTLIFAVVTILCIRAFLALTGYPQLGGGNLHIAHTLWGGLIGHVLVFFALRFLIAREVQANTR